MIRQRRNTLRYCALPAGSPPSPSPPQPRAGSAIVAVDEIDARRFERGAKLPPVRLLRGALAHLEEFDGIDRDACRAGEVGLSPIEQRAAGPALGRGQSHAQRTAAPTLSDLLLELDS